MPGLELPRSKPEVQGGGQDAAWRGKALPASFPRCWLAVRWGGNSCPRSLPAHQVKRQPKPSSLRYLSKHPLSFSMRRLIDSLIT